LTASPIVQNATFDALINYDLDAKLSEALISYNTPKAQAQAGVLGHVFTGFTLNMHGVAGSPNYAVFLQVVQSAGRPEPSAFFSCKIAKNDRSITIGFGVTPSKSQWLSFAPDHGGLHHLHYVLNDYLCDMLSRTPHCQDTSGAQTDIPFPAGARNLRDWTLGGIYLGLETHNRDMRPEAKDHSAQGTVAIGFQIANLHVTRNPGEPAVCR
jgi:hypothetical protein